MNSPDFKEQSEKKMSTYIWVGAFLVVLVWAASGFLVNKYTNDRGTFGDMFGAVNALFSGLAFLGVIVAIYLQKCELQEQRYEIKESRIAQQESSKALKEQSKLFDLQLKIQAINSIIIALEKRASKYGPTMTEQQIKELEAIGKEKSNYDTKLKELVDEYV